MSTPNTIAIPGIPCGNVGSVVRMIEKCGGRASVVASPADLAGFDKVILAGVGAFDYGMSCLQQGGWIDALNDAATHRKVPVLGICLGMQLMCQGSEEGQLQGLQWFDADVRRFRPAPQSGLKVPHMGWNTIDVRKPNPLLAAAGEEQRFYFVHSYYAVCARSEDVLATAGYGEEFVAAFSSGNLFGVQFHPEKSHRFGMALLKNFVALSC
jgi:imidazole glycerol-phosphate synthase subunit HisH